MEKQVPAHVRRGQETRQRVLASTVGIARSEGLDALTIGRISDLNSLTKAGLLGHFPSKVDLQLSTIDRGREEFMGAVIAPIWSKPEGAERLGALLHRWIVHVSGTDGGCMLASIAAEFDARPGVIRDKIADELRGWLAVLESEIAAGVRAGEFKADTDPGSLAFELHGIELSMNLRVQLLGELAARDLAAGSITRAVSGCATRKGKAAFARGWEAYR